MYEASRLEDRSTYVSSLGDASPGSHPVGLDLASTARVEQHPVRSLLTRMSGSAFVMRPRNSHSTSSSFLLTEAVERASDTQRASSDDLAPEAYSLREAANLMRDLAELFRSNRRSDAIDMIYQVIDRSLRMRAYHTVFWVLTVATPQTDADVYPLSAFMSMLAITKRYRDHPRLAAPREALLRRVFARAKREEGEDIAADLLRGLT